MDGINKKNKNVIRECVLKPWKPEKENPTKKTNNENRKKKKLKPNESYDTI